MVTILFSQDLIDRGYGNTGIDFFNETKRYDTIITNPPFKFSMEFVEKALSLSDKYVIMLLKLQFLESERRKSFLQKSPLKYVYVHSKRIVCWKDGNPLDEKGKKWAGTQAYAWFIWEKGYTGEPIIRFL